MITVNKIFIVIGTSGGYYEDKRIMCSTTSEEQAKAVVALFAKIAEYENTFDRDIRNDIRNYMEGNPAPKWNGQLEASLPEDVRHEHGIEYNKRYAEWNANVGTCRQTFIELNYKQIPETEELMKVCSIGRCELAGNTFSYEPIAMITNATKE